MFVVQLRFSGKKAQAGQFMEAHKAWIKRGFDDGVFLLAGSLLPNLGGSIPNDAFAGELGLSTLWVPHSYPACSQHAPDEHLLASVAREGLRIMAGLFWDLGENRRKA